MRRKITWALAISLFAIASAAARPSTGRIAGVVLGANDRPVANADVVIERSDGSHPAATHTDAKGQYAVKFLVQGYYDIRASRGESASPWKHNVIVRWGQTTEVNLRLRRIPPSK
ncbi:MAG TPA: carboxypeptidase-like regulatory domain-containing protein [Candidatus Acidoferrales bacterium]|nr:carboxypeptidase-like regulatory domain-containing protein [Candidatus Acidoferrales bacterium]